MVGKIQILVTVFLVAAALFVAADLCKSDVYAAETIFTVSEYEVDMDEDIFSLDFQEDVTVTEVTSSNTKAIVVGLYDDGDYYDYNEYGSFVYLRVQGVGKSVITATDSEGNTDTCTVTVKPTPFVLSDTEVVFSDYEEDYGPYISSESNDIKSVRSSDNSIVKGILEETNTVKIQPVSAGSAVLTITDIYNQTVAVSVEITQKYIDERTYLDLMKNACEEVYLYYRDTELEFATDRSSKIRDVKIQVQIGSKSYTAKYCGYDGGYYYCRVSNLPAFAAGTNIVCTLTKGEAAYVYRTKIISGNLSNSADFYLGSSWEDILTYTYTGKIITPPAYLYYYNSNYNEFTLRKGTDYKLTYTNNLNVGTAKATATGIGNYAKSSSRTFTIIPKGTSLSKLTAQKKAFTVKWKKQAAKMSKSRINGYQIRYSTKSSMAKAKSVKVKGYAKTSKKISKLKKKTKYYVQIRTYKTVSGKTYYSKWSAKKTVKTR